MELNVIGLAWF